jgi:hypothetical protein
VSAKYLNPRSFVKADAKLELNPMNGIGPSVSASAPLSRRSRLKLELGPMHVGVGAYTPYEYFSATSRTGQSAESRNLNKGRRK